MFFELVIKKENISKRVLNMKNIIFSIKKLKEKEN